jgi:integrative and conjugative element protein (TIGR02256 family)
LIEYAVGSSGQVLVLTDSVLAHFHAHRQVRWYSREAGGQLFARIDGSRIVVVEATGPRSSDRRGLYRYVPSRRAEQMEIVSRYECGLDFVGDWHTHRERRPRPSRTDMQNINECVRRSRHDLGGFLLVVVGQDDPPSGLHVSLNDGASHVPLSPLNTPS